MPVVEDMTAMFNNCSKLTSVDLTGIQMGNTLKSTSSMFMGCERLTTLDLKGLKTSSVTDMSEMFSSDFALETLDVSSFDTSKVTNMNYMFNNCSALNTIAASDKWSTNSIDTAESYGMFDGCTALVGGMGTNKDVITDSGDLETEIHQ